MQNSYESRAPLFQKRRAVFLRHYNSEKSLHPTIQRLLFAGCIHLQPGAPGCTQFCTHPTQFSRRLVILCYDALRSPKAKSPKPLITRDFEDCTQRCDCIKYRVLIFDKTMKIIQSHHLNDYNDCTVQRLCTGCKFSREQSLGRFTKPYLMEHLTIFAQNKNRRNRSHADKSHSIRILFSSLASGHYLT